MICGVTVDKYVLFDSLVLYNLPVVHPLSAFWRYCNL